MDEDVIKLRAQLLKAEGALAEVSKERASLAADVTRFKENMKRGDAELSKAIRAYNRRSDDAED
jgi:cell division protein FtsB